ncbi:hypothetical protein ABT095_17130 [Kitasatospora sp. NPDC002227]|uniref:hypothetical protein n=1 Tax=Kitasatospora sp. NPDC002227 TaxID=3154773 RepID=UPI0033167C83
MACRPIVDGRDILAEVFDEGPAADPGQLLGPDTPLSATDTPRPVRPAEAECTEGCCGAVYVTVLLFQPGRSAIGGGRPWAQLRVTVSVSGDDPAAQAGELAAQLTAEDPRRAAEVCGGSAFRTSSVNLG